MAHRQSGERIKKEKKKNWRTQSGLKDIACRADGERVQYGD